MCVPFVVGAQLMAGGEFGKAKGALRNGGQEVPHHFPVVFRLQY